MVIVIINVGTFTGLDNLKYTGFYCNTMRQLLTYIFVGGTVNRIVLELTHSATLGISFFFVLLCNWETCIARMSSFTMLKGR